MSEINLTPELESIADTRECLANARKRAQDNLKKLREAIGVTQEDFAKVMGVSRATLSYYENGNRTPDLDFINMVGLETECSFDYLLGWSDIMSPKQYSLENLHELNEIQLNRLDRYCASRPFRTLLGSFEFLEMIRILGNYKEYALVNGCDHEMYVWRCINLITPVLESIILQQEAELLKDPQMRIAYDRRRDEVFDLMYGSSSSEETDDEDEIDSLDVRERIKAIEIKNENNPFFAFRQKMRPLKQED